MMNNGYIVTEDESKRIRIMKVWLTLMVIFIHSYSEEYNFSGGSLELEIPSWLFLFKHILSQGVCRIAVPAFFLISSILLYRKPFDYKDNIKKKLRSVIIPYVIINSFWILFYACATSIPSLSIYFSKDSTKVLNWGGYEWLDAYIGITGYPVCGPLWFLRDLFVCNVLSVLIKKAVDKFPKLILCIIAFIWIFNIDLHIFCLDQQALCFFVIGYYICKFNISLSALDKYNKYLFWGIWGMLLCVWEVLLNTSLGVVTTLVRQIAIMVGIICIFRGATIVKNKLLEKWFLKISSYSFGIYLFHEMNLTIVKKLCARALPQTAVWHLAQYIGIPIAIFVGCLTVCVVLQRVCPRIYGVITGNRTM